MVCPCCVQGECTADADCCWCEFAILTSTPTTDPDPSIGLPGCGCADDGSGFWDCFCLVRNPTCGDCNTDFTEYTSALGTSGFLFTGVCCNNQCYTLPCCESRICRWTNNPDFAEDPNQAAVGGWYLSDNQCEDGGSLATEFDTVDPNCECQGDPVEECGAAPAFAGFGVECDVPCSKDNPLP